MDVIREDAYAVELDDREPLAILGLEGWVAGDVDLGKLERVLRPDLLEHGASALAEVAAGRGVEDDARLYG